MLHTYGFVMWDEGFFLTGTDFIIFLSVIKQFLWSLNPQDTILHFLL